MTTTSPPTLPPETLLYEWAERFLDALLSAADVDVIGAKSWWERAKTALETAAQSSASWPQCVARACRKLQITAPDERLSTVVAELGAHLGNPATFAAWRTVAARDALYITAIVREQRTARRKTTPAKKVKPEPAGEPARLLDQIRNASPDTEPAQGSLL